MRNRIGIDLRGLSRVKLLELELDALEQRLRTAGRPEADELRRILDRFHGTLDEDEPDTVR